MILCLAAKKVRQVFHCLTCVFFKEDYSVQEMDWVGQEAIAESISASVLPVGLMTSA